MGTRKTKKTTEVVEVEVIASFYDLQNDETLRKIGDKFTASSERVEHLKRLNLVK